MMTGACKTGYLLLFIEKYTVIVGAREAVKYSQVIVHWSKLLCVCIKDTIRASEN